MEDLHIQVHKNPESLKSLTNVTCNQFVGKSERRFDFKIKITQTDLSRGDDFHRYFQSLSASSVPFMVQHSEYIEKLDFMNSFGGATLVSASENNSGCLENRVFQADIANPEIIEEIERKKNKMLRSVTPEDVIKEFLYNMAATEKEFEDVDIPGNLYMFDMMNGVDYEEEFEDEFEPEEALDNNFELKFNATGSIKLLDDNILEVKYDESGMTGFKGAFVRYLFDIDKKDAVAIHRCGYTDTWLNCEKGERISGTAKSYSVTVDTKEIINNMTPDGGQLLISYIREMNGAPAEKVTHVVSAFPARE